jgi:hypothetical protein
MMQQFAQQHELQNTPPGVAMAYMAQGQQQMQMAPMQQVASMQAMAQPTLQSPPPMPQLEQQAGFYHPERIEPSEEHRRLAAAMGAAGLQSIVHNGRVVKEYMTIPFQQRWRKRPYGFTRESLPQQPQQQPHTQ